MYHQDPHIISTENMRNIDGSPVVPFPDYTEPAAVSYQRRIGVLERQEAELIAKLEAFCEVANFTERQRQLIAEYKEDGKAQARPRSLRARFKYRRINAAFIEGYRKMQDKLAEVKRELQRFRRLYERETSDPTELIERLKKLMEEEGGDSSAE